MIVKSSSRKDNSFHQLINYIFKEEELGHSEAFTFCHNLGGNELSREEIAAKFKENNTFRKSRKGGVSVYHEFLSFSPEDREQITREILEDLASQYIERRAPNAIAIARPEFDDKDHIHIHFVISGNEQESSKVTRVSKAEFATIKKEIQRYQEQEYPFLKSYVHERDKEKYQDKDYEKLNHKAKQMKDRGVKRTKKQEREQEIFDTFKTSSDMMEFVLALKEKGYRTYGRNGRAYGIYISNGKKRRRFSSLFKNQSQEMQGRFGSFEKDETKAREVIEKIKSWEDDFDFFEPDTKEREKDDIDL